MQLPDHLRTEQHSPKLACRKSLRYPRYAMIHVPGFSANDPAPSYQLADLVELSRDTFDFDGPPLIPTEVEGLRLRSPTSPNPHTRAERCSWTSAAEPNARKHSTLNGNETTHMASPTSKAVIEQLPRTNLGQLQQIQVANPLTTSYTLTVHAVQHATSTEADSLTASWTSFTSPKTYQQNPTGK